MTHDDDDGDGGHGCDDDEKYQNINDSVHLRYCGETLHVPGLEGGFGTHFSEPATTLF